MLDSDPFRKKYLAPGRFIVTNGEETLNLYLEKKYIIAGVPEHRGANNGKAELQKHPSVAH